MTKRQICQAQKCLDLHVEKTISLLIKRRKLIKTSTPHFVR